MRRAPRHIYTGIQQSSAKEAFPGPGMQQVGGKRGWDRWLPILGWAKFDAMAEPLGVQENSPPSLPESIAKARG